MASTWAPPSLALALSLQCPGQADPLLPAVASEADDAHDDSDDESDPWSSCRPNRLGIYDVSTRQQRRVLVKDGTPGQLHLLTAPRSSSAPALLSSSASLEPPSPTSLTSSHATPARSPSALGIAASTSIDTSLALAEEAQLTSSSSASQHHADAEELLEAQYHGGRVASWTGHHHHASRHRELSSPSSSVDPPRPTSQKVASLVAKGEPRSPGIHTPASALSIPHTPSQASTSDALLPTALLQLPSPSTVVSIVSLGARDEALVLQHDGSLTWLDGDLRACSSICLDEPCADLELQYLQRPDGTSAPPMVKTASTAALLNESTSSTPLLTPFSHLKDLLRSGSSDADGSSRAASPAPTWPASASASMSRATSTLTAAALAKGKGRERDAVLVSLTGLREGWKWVGVTIREGQEDADATALFWTEAKMGRTRRLTQVRLDRLDRKIIVTRALEIVLGSASVDVSLQEGGIRLRWMADGERETRDDGTILQWSIPAQPSTNQHGVISSLPSSHPVVSPGLAKELASLADESLTHVEVHAGRVVAFVEDRTAHVLEESSGRLKLLGQDIAGVAAVRGGDSMLLVLTARQDGVLGIEEVDPDGPRRSLWSAAGPRHASPSITAALPLSLERVLVAVGGSLHLRSLSALVGCHTHSLLEDRFSMAGSITLLRQTTHSRNGARLVVAGTAQGNVGFWAVDAASTTLIAEWSLFASPLAHVLSFGDDGSKLRLNGCLVAVSVDGTIAVILVDGLKLLYHIPGRGASLVLLAARSDELLLLYSDSRARVWDLRSQELRRSVGLDQALAMLDDDGNGSWTRHALQDGVSASSGVLSVVSAPQGTLRADLRRAIEASSRAVEAGEPSASPGARRALSVLRPLLFSLAGADADVGAGIQVLLELDETDAAAVPLVGGVGGEREVRLISSKQKASPTQILAVVAMLNVLGKVKEWQEPSAAIAASLVAKISQHPLGASLPALAAHFVDTNAEIREASRALFTAALDTAPETDIERLCDEWQPLLPSRRAEDSRSPTTLTLLGIVAATHYKSLSPSLLKDVSSSIAAYMADEGHPERQVIAIELCCRAWSVWQSCLDAMEVVRNMFSLATTTASALATEKSAGGQMAALLDLRRSSARRATLQIAAENTPLFMTTLSLDILHARSPAHCSATMRLVAFMVRGEPLILHPNLPRLAEAVVKSLDPTATAFREAVVEAATVMIGELVRAYPTIAFHGKLQRLAVGTHEGAVIMYDLRTATRLYVIEAHRAQLSGCDFSPDGRRLVTVSVKERRALVWKVGSTIASIFAPGSLPRQGGANDAGAYKAVDLNPAHNDELPPPDEPLRAVLFQWLGDRNAHITVGSLQRSIDVA